MVKPHSSNFRVITTNFLGVRIFRKLLDSQYKLKKKKKKKKKTDKLTVFQMMENLTKVGNCTNWVIWVFLIWAWARQNQQNGLCAQQKRVSLISSLCAWRNLGSLATQWAHSEESDQTESMSGWSESSLGAQVILLVLSCCGSFDIRIVAFRWICSNVFFDH